MHCMAKHNDGHDDGGDKTGYYIMIVSCFCAACLVWKASPVGNSMRE